MTDETTTSLVEADDTQAGEPDGTEGFETGVEQQDEEQPELDENGDEEEAEDEEVELDADLKLKVPKAAAAKLKELQEGNLRQADYTRKTQALAEQTKAVGALKAQVEQANVAELSARAHIMSVDGRMRELDDFARSQGGWVAWKRADPFEAGEAETEFNGLERGRNQAVNYVGQLQQQRTLEQQRETVKLIEEGKRTLAKDIPGWSDDLAAKLLDTGVKQYGFDRAEIQEFTDPRMVKVLHDAHQFHLLQAAKKKTANIAAGQEVKPVQTLRGTSGRAPVSAATRDFAAFEKLATAKSK